MLSKTFIATLLASTAAASPIVANAGSSTFKLISLAQGPGSPFQGLEIVAHNGALWIGKTTTAYCPLKDNCPTGNSTAFTSNGNGNVAMNVVVPGGQQLYISTDYGVKYTAPHSADIHGGKADSWTYSPPGVPTPTSVGVLEYPGYGFLACADPEGEGIYSINATPGGTGTGNCTSIRLGTEAYTGAPVWEYS
ncbi:hypothetical protein ACMFMG_005243 [Clarireedia jacksonii]